MREFDHTSERADDGRWLRRNHLTRYSSKVPDWFVKDKTSGVRVCDANLAHSLYLADIGMHAVQYAHVQSAASMLCLHTNLHQNYQGPIESTGLAMQGRFGQILQIQLWAKL